MKLEILPELFHGHMQVCGADRPYIQLTRSDNSVERAVFITLVNGFHKSEGGNVPMWATSGGLAKDTFYDSLKERANRVGPYSTIIWRMMPELVVDNFYKLEMTRNRPHLEQHTFCILRARVAFMNWSAEDIALCEKQTNDLDAENVREAERKAVK